MFSKRIRNRFLLNWRNSKETKDRTCRWYCCSAPLTAHTNGKVLYHGYSGKKKSRVLLILLYNQHAFSRKLQTFWYVHSRVMVIAQQLYEGIDLGPEETGWLITYMRTDSGGSAQALNASTCMLSNHRSERIPSDAPRTYKSKRALRMRMKQSDLLKFNDHPITVTKISE